MLSIALELATVNVSYEDIATKFFEHFVNISSSNIHLWNEPDGMFYDHLTGKDGFRRPVQIRSFVGLIPLFATCTIEEAKLERLPGFKSRMNWFLRHRKHLIGKHHAFLEAPVAAPNVHVHAPQPHAQQMHASIKPSPSFIVTAAPTHSCRLLSLVSLDQIPRLLERMLDEQQFLSPYGLRSLSKEHEKSPFHFSHGGFNATLTYEPGESTTGMFGGNSNWRGPVWFPVNYLMIERLQVLDHYFGETLKVEFPTGSGKRVTLWEVSKEISQRLINIFRPDSKTHARPVNAGNSFFDTDPRWKNYIPFYEYFHGDSGAGIGASHQTGWTALVAKLIQQQSCTTASRE
jgi:hypothetical protein